MCVCVYLYIFTAQRLEEEEKNIIIIFVYTSDPRTRVVMLLFYNCYSIFTGGGGNSDGGGPRSGVIPIINFFKVSCGVVVARSRITRFRQRDIIFHVFHISTYLYTVCAEASRQTHFV